MERTLIGNLRPQIGQTVKIQGWLQTLRDQKKMQFLVVRDRTGAVQVVYEKKAGPELAEQISKLTAELAVTITGLAIDNPIVKLGGIEIQLTALQVDNLADSPCRLTPLVKRCLSLITAWIGVSWTCAGLRTC